MSSDNPLVSVVIPTYNRPELLQRAVRSVLSQTYDNIELIVVDDASNIRIDPESEFNTDLVTAFEYIYLEKNHGGAGARNIGLNKAGGKYIAFLDDDDEWFSEKVEQQVGMLEAVSDDVGLVYTAVLQYEEEPGIEDVHFNPVPENHIRELMLKQYIGTMSSVMIQSEVINRIGGLNEEFPCWHDWEFYFRVGQQFEFAAIDKPLVRQYVGPHEQISDEFDRKKRVSKLLIEQTFDDMSDKYNMSGEVRGSQYYSLSHSAYRSGQPLQAIILLLRAITLRPFVPSYYKYLILYLGGRKIQYWLS
jgi:glycosyltransferase involved in cell wall biosynthesis